MRISLIITLILLIILFLIANINVTKINSKNDISKLLPNQRVLVSGKVIKETPTTNYNKLLLENNVELKCFKPCKFYINKTIVAKAKVEEYKEIKSLRILSITFINPKG